MTDTELKKLIEDCCDDIFNRLEPLANVKSRLYESLKPAINYTRCCKSDSEQFNCYEMHAYSRFAGCSKQCKECEDNEKSKAI